MSQSSSPLLFHLTTGGDRLRWHRYQRTMMNILSLSFNNFNEPQTEFTTVRAHAEGWNNWIFSARRISTRESNKHVAVERERERTKPLGCNYAPPHGHNNRVAAAQLKWGNKRKISPISSRREQLKRNGANTRRCISSDDGLENPAKLASCSRFTRDANAAAVKLLTRFLSFLSFFPSLRVLPFVFSRFKVN